MKYIIGAYATAPSLADNDKLNEHKFYEKLIESIPEIRGLEIPFWGKEIHQFGSDFLLDIIDKNWENVLTCIPGSMSKLAKNPKFGLASDDENGRAEAIAMHKRANQVLHKMNAYYGRQSAIAVQIATAPSTPVKYVSSSTDSLLKSMEEILSWDWEGAKIVIEHCDTAVDNIPFEKGFLTIEDEIKTLIELQDMHNVGITINWARSAKEIHQFGSDFLLDIIDKNWENVLTCIPGSMSKLANNPKFGLASDDENGRAEAVAMHKKVNQVLHKMK